ncbi:MAG TPA: branched-chain amino acid ABC transporter permease [Nevskiaceae bacterium]
MRVPIRRAWLGAALLPVLLVLVPPFASAIRYPYLVTVINQALIYAIAAMALDFIMGYGRLVSFGHAAFFGLGAYTVGILSTQFQQGAPFILGWMGTNEAFVAWPLAMAVSAAFALVVGVISLRTTGLFFIMITLAFGQMAYFFFISLSAYGGDNGLTLSLPNTIAGSQVLSSGVPFYYVCFVLLLATWWLLRRFVNSRFGRVLQGSRQNERRMRALGFRTFPYKLVAFTISGAIAGLAGALIANQSGFVSPAIMHWQQSAEFLVMVLLGGLSSLVGPIYGAIALVLLDQVLVAVTPHWEIILGPILVLVVLFFRGGIYGALSGKGDRA